jgi:histidinol-phosphate phosphatase family protein
LKKDYFPLPDMQLSTLFLDRDGVINRELPGDYVKTIDAFIFEDGVTEALTLLKPWFKRIIVVTNQRGVGAGLMTSDDLHNIHEFMRDHLRLSGIHIDAIFSATDEDRSSHRRKPNPWLGEQARIEYPEIEFRYSLMIGNSISDLEFGKHLGMITGFVDDKHKYAGKTQLPLADCKADSLLELAKKFESEILPLFPH